MDARAPAEGARAARWELTRGQQRQTSWLTTQHLGTQTYLASKLLWETLMGRPERLHTWWGVELRLGCFSQVEGERPPPTPSCPIPPSPQGRGSAGSTHGPPTPWARWLDPCPPHPQGGPWPTHRPMSRRPSEWPLSPARGKSFSWFSVIFLQVQSSPHPCFVFLR